MDSKFTFSVECDCGDDVCECTGGDLYYMYEVTGDACSRGDNYIDVDWSRVSVENGVSGDGAYTRSFEMESAIIQVVEDLANDIDRHFSQINGAFYLINWNFTEAHVQSHINGNTGKRTTAFRPNRLTIILTEVDCSRVAAYL